MENEWKSKHVAVIGVGSVGSAVADMLARAGVGRLTLVDPDVLSEDNLKRHVLTRESVGRNKAEAMAERLGCTGIPGKFAALPELPDVIASCVDSLVCESQISAYSLENNVPVVYGGVHGDAHTAEIITVIPGVTPCYECYERVGELPTPGQEAYTDPNYDKTKMPSQPGLWVDVLMAASLQVQAVLGVLGVRERMAPLVLMSLRYPFKTEAYSQKERCAVCSENMEGLWKSI